MHFFLEWNEFNNVFFSSLFSSILFVILSSCSTSSEFRRKLFSLIYHSKVLNNWKYQSMVDCEFVVFVWEWKEMKRKPHNWKQEGILQGYLRNAKMSNLKFRSSRNINRRWIHKRILLYSVSFHWRLKK